MVNERGGHLFVNRRRELASLEEHYRSERAELYVLYGRRRVGKTELLQTFGMTRRCFTVAMTPATTYTPLASLVVCRPTCSNLGRATACSTTCSDAS
jgi:hypothetical protein